MNKTAAKNRNTYKLTGLAGESFRDSSGSRERFGSSRPKLDGSGNKHEAYPFLNQRPSAGLNVRKITRGMMRREEQDKSRNVGTVAVVNSQNTRGGTNNRSALGQTGLLPQAVGMAVAAESHSSTQL